MNQNQTSGMSRRDLLKKGAVAGGIVWTAPLVLSDVAGAQPAPGSPAPADCLHHYSAQLVTPGGASGIIGATCISLGGGASCFPDGPTYQEGCGAFASAALEGGKPVVYLNDTLNGTPIQGVSGFSKANDCAPATVTKVGSQYRLEYPPTVTNSTNSSENNVSNVQFTYCTP